jgi:hypothetical protein
MEIIKELIMPESAMIKKGSNLDVAPVPSYAEC